MGVASQPDINAIPVSAIERIEVLPSTAAGIYGGGATGGVINIILRHDYNGLEVALTRENPETGGGSQNRVDLNGGLNFEGGRSSVTFSASFSNGNDLLADDGDLVQRGQNHVLEKNPAAIYAAPTPPLGATANIQSAPSFDFGCFCQLPGGNLTLKPQYGGAALGSKFTYLPAGYSGVATDNGTALVRNAGNYNLNLADTAQAGAGQNALFHSPTIKSFNTTLRREFSSRIQAFIDAGASENVSTVPYNSLSGTFLVSAFAPSNPFAQDVMVTLPLADGDQTNRVSLKSRKIGAGVIVGLTENWQGAFDYTWSRNRYFSSLPNFSLDPDASMDVMLGAVDVFRDANSYKGVFSTYLLGPQVSGPATSTTSSYVSRVAGPVPLALPGGELRLTAALEHRDESLDDFIVKTPTGAGLPDETNTFFNRSRKVDSAYVELHFPIVSPSNGVSGVRSLDVELSGRWDRYKTESSNSSFSGFPTAEATSQSSFTSVDPLLALRWQVTPDATFRFSAGTGFTPPSLADLAPGGSTPLSPFLLSLFGITDPLRGGEPLGASGKSVIAYTGGNPGLRPEDSRSVSAGVVLTPRFAAGLRVSVDWTQIRKTDNVGTLEFNQTSVNLESSVPGLILRDAPTNDGYSVGPIVGFNARRMNIAKQSVRALDIAAEYQFAATSLGDFSFSAAATRNTQNELQVTAASPVTDQLGATVYPKIKGNATLAWKSHAWRASWTTRYTDSYWVNAEHTISPNQGSATISSQTYHDLQAGYSFNSLGGGLAALADSEVRVGVRNVFNRRPNIDVTNFDHPYSYSSDPRLRIYWLSLRKSF